MACGGVFYFPNIPICVKSGGKGREDDKNKLTALLAKPRQSHAPGPKTRTATAHRMPDIPRLISGTPQEKRDYSSARIAAGKIEMEGKIQWIGHHGRDVQDFKDVGGPALGRNASAQKVPGLGTVDVETTAEGTLSRRGARQIWRRTAKHTRPNKEVRGQANERAGTHRNDS